MAKADQDATIKRGGSYKLEFQIDDEDGVPLELTGLTLAYRIAMKAHSSTALLTVASGDITRKEDATVGTSDIAVVPLLSAQTDDLPAEGLYHELYQVDGAGERYPLAYGTLTVQHAQVAFHA